MSGAPALRFEPLSKKHDRAKFRCGEPALDDWFRARASQDEKRGLTRVFVAVDGEDDAVAGFYSLSAFTLAPENLPDDLKRKLPRYENLPAALIGRLARSEKMHGRGVGELLVADAIKRILGASETLALYAILVESKHARASKFYRSFGFIPFPDTPNRLFLLTSTARAALSR